MAALYLSLIFFNYIYIALDTTISLFILFLNLLKKLYKIIV